MPASIKVFVAVVAVFVACMHAVEARMMADTAGVCSSDVLTKSAENTKDCFPDEAAFCANYRCVNAFVAISQSSDFGCRLPDGFTSSTVKDNATAMLKKCTEEQKKEAVEKANATNEDQQLSLPDGAMTLKQCSVSVALAALVAMAVMQL
ncbi:hypothetical protein Poli38472_002564 [Pythium oligandrum]|uniref:Elicitin-like protein n=1 Tax=Pythium oligandrum TaxID=41045 RepID=A0A8K1CJL3_PYTOL|nr:hypothetical protein Poli38472_002564 [Pythium oligandrum]|eukprot:TMW63623.1 hypothetical protein Poli38472_002564 [Pythium oligandrum]